MDNNWNSTSTVTAVGTGIYDNTMIGTLSTADLSTITLTDTISLGNVSIYNTGTTTTGNDFYFTDTLLNTSNKSLSVQGDAEIKGSLKVNGKDIGESLEKIEEHLAILKPDPALEERWEELRNLRNEYEALKQSIMEKEKLYEILSK